MTDPVFTSDLQIITQRGWFPKTDIPELEALRERHEELIAVRDAKQAERRALSDQFKAEDRAHQAALDEAYRTGAEPDLPSLAPPEERRAKREEAEAHATAAARAVVSFARQTLSELRGNEPVPAPFTPWTYASVQRVPAGGTAATVLAKVASEESELRSTIDEAQRTIEAASHRLREFTPLKHWLVHNGSGGFGMVLRGDEMPVPPSHTPGTKPRDLHVPGWFPDPEGGHDAPNDTVPEGQEHLIPAEAQSGVVEMSDPWFTERERQEA